MAVTVSDNGDGTMTAVVEYANEEGTAPTFTNVVNHGDLLFGKKVKDFEAGNKETEFTFTFSLKDADGNALTEEHDYWIYTATSVPDENTEKTGTVTDGSTVTLKDGEFCLVKGLHTDTQYVVTEEETENFKLISVKDAAGNEYADLQATGSIGANETSEATFENEDVTPMTLTVTKVVEGYDPKLEYSPFKFSLTLKDSNKKELKGIEFKYAIEKAGPGNRRETGTIMSGAPLN